MIARWIGAAPRQRGSFEACTLKQPSRGASRMGFGKQKAISDDDGSVGLERRERGAFGSRT